LLFNRFFKWESTKVQKTLAQASPSNRQMEKKAGPAWAIVSRAGSRGFFPRGDALGLPADPSYSAGFPEPIIRGQDREPPHFSGTVRWKMDPPLPPKSESRAANCSPEISPFCADSAED